MVLTYHEAELAAADAMSSAAPDLWSVGTGNYLARIVLSAVGYADLLTEIFVVDRTSQANANAHMDAERRVRESKAEIERLRATEGVCSHQNARYLALLAERDALAAAVARVEALSVDSRDRGGFGGVRLSAHVRIADLRAALHPEVS